MDWFAKASVTHRRSLLWFRSNLTHQKLTDILNDLPILNCCSSPFFFFFLETVILFASSHERVQSKVRLTPDFTFLLGRMFCMTRRWMRIHLESAVSFLLLSLCPLFCSFALSFSISQAGRCFQCSYCHFSKSRGGGSWDPRPPPNNGHMLPPLWDSRVCVCVCVCDGWRCVMRALWDWEAPLIPLSCSPVLVAGVMANWRSTMTVDNRNAVK